MNQKKNSVLQLGFGVFMLLAVWSLAGCQSEKPPAAESLEDRILARWTAVIERDFETAWGFYSPGFRQTNPLEPFVNDMNGRPIRWLEAELLQLDCEDDVCNVRLRVVYTPVVGPAGLIGTQIPTILDERWLRIDDRWWFVAD